MPGVEGAANGGWPEREKPRVEDAMSQATSHERKTPIVSLASTKGGVGKTTLAYVLATEVARRLAHAASQGYSAPIWRGRVTCIDADPNRTLAQVLHLTNDRLITCVESDSDR